MLQVQIEGESCRLSGVPDSRRDSREHPRHALRVLLELGKLLPQERLFISDHRKIDREEHHDQNNAHPPTARGHGKANRRSATIRDTADSACKRKVPKSRAPRSCGRARTPARESKAPAQSRSRRTRGSATWAAPARSTAPQTQIPAALGCGARTCATTQP